MRAKADSTTKLTIFLLGNPQICLDGQVVTSFNTRKDFALLAFLAISGTSHSRETLASLLWPDVADEKARRNLRHALFHLRKAIGPHWVETSGGVALTQEHPWSVDVHTLHSVVQSLQAEIAVKPAPDSAVDRLQKDLDQVLTLYRGEFLEGFYISDAVHFEEWVVRQREAIHLTAMRGLVVVAEHCLAIGDHQLGLKATRRLLELEPWFEQVHRWQMHLLALGGRRTEALAQYERCRTVLADELGVEPEQATVDLYEEIRAGTLTAKGPQALRQNQDDAWVVPHAVPGQLTAFFGRSEELARVHTLLLSPAHRLITVVGEGGIGKTRFALTIAQALVDEIRSLSSRPSDASSGQMPPLLQIFPDGIYFVSLAEIGVTETVDDQLTTEVTDALGLQFAGSESLNRQLFDYLRNKRLLLLLDNVEHLLPRAADFVVELLRRAPGVKLLVTSRHRLNVQAAVVIRLNGLSTPTSHEAATSTPDALLTYPSVNLFVERARRAIPTFQLTPANKIQISEICRIVDGMPLAIELAATRTYHATCQQILAELLASYTILESGLQDLPPRHRSIRVLLDSSWQTLGADGADLLAACSVFHGPFDAPAVAGIIDVSFSRLLSLVDRSLLQLVQSDAGADQPRFALHELIRQYGAAKLEAQPGAAQRLRTAHCRYYLTMLSEQSQVFIHDRGALKQMQSQLPNLRAAWEWAGIQGEWALLADSAFPMRKFYDLLSLFHEGESHFGQTVEQARRALHTQPVESETSLAHLVAHLQAHQAHFCMRMDQNDKAEELALAALELGRRLDDHAVQGYVFLDLSTIYGVRTDWARAQHAAEQVPLHARAADLPMVEVVGLINLGCTFLYRSLPDQALHHLQQAMALYQGVTAKTGAFDLLMEGLLCLDLAMAFQQCGDLAQARSYCQRSVEIYRQMDIPVLGVYALVRLSEMDALFGNYLQAGVQAQMALDICQTISSRVAESTALGYLTYASMRQENWEKTEQTCRTLLECIRPLGLTIMRPFAHFLQGEILRQRKEWGAALEAYRSAQHEYAQIEQKERAVSAQIRMARIYQESGDLLQAVALVEQLLPQLAQTTQNSWLETNADHLICYEILAAVEDPRALEVMRRACADTHAQARRIVDPTLRHAYLTQVAANRVLVELGARDLHADAGQLMKTIES